MYYNFEKRNSDFLKAVRAEISATAADGRRPTMEHIVKATLTQAAPSFYVDVCHAQRIIRRRLIGTASQRFGSLHEQMWSEIERRVISRLSEKNGISVDDAVVDVLDRGCAPRFYLSPSYAVRLCQRMAANSPKKSI